MVTELTPRGIVAELDKYIVGQKDAKRMVAVAIRNRWRRQRLKPEMRDEVAPKNIIMMGPTGVGKTEIARRVAKLCGVPFVKVEATKYTEVGYVGRDVESMVRDLMEAGVALVKLEEKAFVREKAEEMAENRLLDHLLPQVHADKNAFSEVEVNKQPTIDSTREKLRAMWRAGRLDDREIEIEVTQSGGSQVDFITMPGMEQVGSQLRDAFGKMFPTQKKRKKMKVSEAYVLLEQEESEKLIDSELVIEKAKFLVEQNGIIFIDEIDKIAIPAQTGKAGSDISREGVQRDLLPIVEGSSVSTKYGTIATDHILFIAAGAFHISKPSDLIPELQGRFPLRVELSGLNKEDFLRILQEPHNALTLQYEALMETEGVTLQFEENALEAIAEFAELANEQTENIGARRLYTIMERILSDLSFEASERSGETVVINADTVHQMLSTVKEDADLSRFIL